VTWGEEIEAPEVGQLTHPAVFAELGSPSRSAFGTRPSGGHWQDAESERLDVVEVHFGEKVRHVRIHSMRARVAEDVMAGLREGGLVLLRGVRG
jgi:hypothetical protein